MILKEEALNMNTINRVYGKLYPKPYDANEYYCRSCCHFVKNFNNHLLTKVHQEATRKLDVLLINQLKDMLYHRWIN